MRRRQDRLLTLQRSAPRGVRSEPWSLEPGEPPVAARSGLTLLEVTVSTLLVGLLLVTSLRAVGAVLRFRSGSSDTQRGLLLADDLTAEILGQEYIEPVEAPVFGRELSEMLNGRTAFDDVDDYHLWSRSPPEDRDGNQLAGFSGWSRSVAVEWVNPSNPSLTVLSDQGAKRITVTVSKNGTVAATLQALRTDY